MFLVLLTVVFDGERSLLRTDLKDRTPVEIERERKIHEGYLSGVKEIHGSQCLTHKVGLVGSLNRF